MPENDLLKLEHAVRRLEDALNEDARQIDSLKADVKELLSLVRLLDASIQKVVITPVQGNTFQEFQQRLKNMLGRHGMAS
jgi:predicted RNase H-like nuclease (RuvC/YqgF family)